MVEDDGVATQVGVGSFVSGFGCHVGMPGGFTRPGHYQDWIRQVTGINFDQRIVPTEDAVDPSENLKQNDFKPQGEEYRA